MIIEAARAAARQLVSPAIRGVLLKSLGLTVAALFCLWLGLTALVDRLAAPWLQEWTSGSWAGWLGPLAIVVAGIVFALGLGLMIAPVTALVAGLFLDEVADKVEREDYPSDPPGRALPAVTGFVMSMKFFGVVVLGNILALLLLLVPGVNIGAFFVVNGYLIGREYFEFAASRHRPEAEAKALRRAYRGTVFLAGLTVAGLMAVPILNLAAPLFACALMVHLHKAVAAADDRRRVMPT